jgi:hypothetical protein
MRAISFNNRQISLYVGRISFNAGTTCVQVGANVKPVDKSDHDLVEFTAPLAQEW